MVRSDSGAVAATDEGMKMDKKWTPGPWAVDGDGIKALVRGSDATIVAVRHRLPSETHEANAHLIASAPELYEALSSCADAINRKVDFTSESPSRLELIASAEVARAALAKARGE